jgi:hypothetical protein
LKKRTSINSNSVFHKEKEMADFRKWLFAFAVVALLLVAGAPANAQVINPTAFTCGIAATVPPTVRAEGIAELVGDVVLQCSGGTPTNPGSPIPLANITIFLNTNVTSRLVGGQFTNASEAMLLIDEPYPTAGINPTTQARPPSSAPQGYCQVSATGNLNPNCPLTGTVAANVPGTPPGGVGVNGPYAVINVFQGQQAGANAVAWNGVPVDAPGTTGVRVLRFTNIRANACQLGISSTLVPTQLFAFISSTGSQQISIAGTNQSTVAFAQAGLISSVSTAATYLQCNNLNGTLISSSTPQGTTAAAINLRADEGFVSSFKTRGFAADNLGSVTVALQNVPGYPYFTESGFVFIPTTGPTGQTGTGTGAIGVADTGTRILFAVNSVGAGVNLFAPAVVNLIVQGTATASGGQAILVTGTDANGNGGSLSTSTSTTPTIPITVSGTSGFVVYEIVRANPTAPERLSVGLAVAFVSNTASNLPGIGQSTVTISFAPLSTVTTASATAPVPRFCTVSVARNVFAIITCTCDLLFPFVTNQAGFDTGIALANTSLDPFGTTPQNGTVTLNYYGNTTGGGAAPAAQTSQTVPAGTELIFTLSGGGNLGIAATPGFSGYIIAVAKFQFCHAFAFISDAGSSKLAEGYLAIQLDIGGLNRTNQLGEVQAH